MQGRSHLAGSVSGDPDLLALKAARRLAAADAMVAARLKQPAPIGSGLADLPYRRLGWFNRRA